MGLFDHFPYTNFHELNLDWILNALKELEHTINQFVAINALKYADPIQWNIVQQYEKNTIVIDPLSGTAYISVQPVPSGVALTNTDYWTVVFDLGSFVTRAAQNFTDRWEESTTLTATFSSGVNDWLIWGDRLYKVLSPIVAGDQYVIDSNIEHFTLESIIGHLEDLTTEDKSNLVAAINEVLTTLVNIAGDLDDLNTVDKSNLVAAINEVLLTLTNTTGDLADLNTQDKTNLVSAINELTINRLLTVDTVADLVSYPAQLNDMIYVAGYYNVNDMGAGIYYIVDNGNYQITLNNGLYARLIHNGVANIAQYGASKSDGNKTKQALDQMIADNLKCIVVPVGNWLVTGSVNIPRNMTIKGTDVNNCLLTQTDKTSDLFVIGSASLNAAVHVSDLQIWNNPDTTNIPNKNSGTGTGASNKCFNIVLGKASTFKNVKINRFEYAFYIDDNNFTLDFIECKIHSNTNGIYFDYDTQAVNISMCDFDNDSLAIRFEGGIGALVVDKCQIENCYVGIRKTTSGDVKISDCYFDANGRRAIELIGALRLAVIEDCIFLENSLANIMNDATGMTSGEVFLIRNVANSINATEFIRVDNSATTYNINTKLVNNAIMSNNTSTWYNAVYDKDIPEASAHGVLAGSTANSPITLKKAFNQRIYNAFNSGLDFTLDFSVADELPVNSRIVIYTTLSAGCTITFTGATSISASTYTNSGAATVRLMINAIKVGNSTWEIKVLS